MKKITSLILIFVFSFLLAACPKQNELVKAFEVSESIAKYAGVSATTIGDLFEAKVISFETKEKLIAKLRIVAQNGKRFNDEIKALAKIYREKLPDEQVNALDILFNREVITPFAEILVEAGLLSREKSEKIYTAILLLKNAVLFIANFFGKVRSESISFQFYLKENANV